MESKREPSVSKGFVWAHATAANGGAMAISATISTYFTLYVQEEIGITAAQLSIVMLIGSLWDVFTTPVMGVLCDSLNPKWGRYRTWFIFTPVLLLIDMFILFSNPGFIQSSAAAKCVYVCLGFLLYSTIVSAYTMPHAAILPAMVLDDGERNSILAKGAGCTALMFTIASTFSEQLVAFFGSYRRLMCMYAVLAIISFWWLFRTSEERYVSKTKEPGGFRQLIYVFRHKEIWPVMLCWCLATISYGFMFTSSVYYAQYLWAPKLVDLTSMDEATIGSTVGSTISTYMGAISIGALISMVILMPLFLRLFKTGWKVTLVSQALTVVCYVLLYLFGTKNWIFCLVVSFIATAVGGMVNATVNILVNDTIDFILLKEGRYLNGIVASVRGFAQKAGSTVVNAGMLAILAAAGFNASLGPFGQSESALAATNAVRFLVPSAVSLLIVIIMVFYPLRKYFPEIAEMKEKMARELGESDAGNVQE